MKLKKLVALIAALAMLLCSTAMAASLFKPDDMVSAYNNAIYPSYLDLTDDASLARAVEDALTVKYDSDSTPGNIDFWVDSWNFCISFDASSRSSTGTNVHFYCNYSDDSETGVLPLLPAVVAISQVDPSVDAAALLEWVMAMEDGSRFDSSKWHAYMSCEAGDEYMGFMLFAD